MQKRLAFTLELDMAQVGESVEGLLEIVEGQVALRHVAPAAVSAGEVAARGGLDLRQLDRSARLVTVRRQRVLPASGSERERVEAAW